MRRHQAVDWVEAYLYRARGHRALEQSVFAAGERAGFSERRLRRAGRSIGVTLTGGCWELPAARCSALDTEVMRELDPAPRSLPSVGAITGTPVRSRRLA
jgi:hypothetical protein